MKRDMDLCREILLMIEKASRADVPLSELNSVTTDKTLLNYHLELLCEANLLRKIEVPSTYSFRPSKTGITNVQAHLIWTSVELTWNGHEFLDAARNNKNWEQAKQVGNKVGGLTLDVMKDVLIGLAKEQLRGLGLPAI